MSRCFFVVRRELFNPYYSSFCIYTRARKDISAYGVRCAVEPQLKSAPHAAPAAPPPPHHLVTRIRICVVVVLQPHLTLFAYIYLFICVYNTRTRVCSSTHIPIIRKYRANKFVAAPMQTNDIALVCGGGVRGARDSSCGWGTRE